MSGMISSLARRNMKALASAIGATLIGFVQSGIGAVLRSILEKMRETVSAQDFGVAGDGTDETTKMQKALDSLTQGGTLICPPNATILISAQLTFKPNTRLELNGATIKQKAGANTGDLMYVGASASGVTIRNGTIDINVVGQAYVGAKTDVGRAIFAYKAVGLRVKKVKFKNPYGSMILAASSSNIVVEKCDINDANGTGTNAIVFNSCVDATVSKCSGSGKLGVTGYGIYAFGPSSKIRAINNSLQYWQIVFIGNDYITGGGLSSMVYCRIDGNTLLDPSADTSIHFGLYGSVAKNIIVNSRDVGISMDYSRNMAITGNVIRTTNAGGIAMPGCIDCTVTGNAISNPGSQWVKPVDNGQRSGIWMPVRFSESAPSITPSGNVIVGNTIRDSLGVPQMYFGISIANVGGTNVNYVKGNYIDGSVGADLDIPSQTNIGAEQKRKYPLLLNSWVAYGSAFDSLSFYKDEIGTGYTAGLVKGGAVGSVIAILPVGYRVTAQTMFAVITDTGVGRVDFFPNGNVVLVTGGTGFVSLSGLSFPCR